MLGSLFVPPVRRDAVLGPFVHLVGPDLDLDGFALGTHDGGVQGLVQVEFRGVDVVLEAARHRWPEGMHDAERRPAVLLCRHDHADGDEVGDVVELLRAHDHLLVDAPEVLRATGDLRLDAELGQPSAHGGEHLGKLGLAPRRTRRNHLGDLGKPLRVLGLEGQILELPLDLLDPEAVSERGVDVEGLAGDAVAFPLRQGIDRAHVVQPVGELDHEHAPVACHRHEELAHGGGLLCLLRPEPQPVELRDAVDDVGHLWAELAADLVEIDLRVLDGVVQQGGTSADGVEPELGHDRRHGHRVGDVGLARGPSLALVRLGRHVVSSPHG